ncbi:deoxyguanosinetriphosphate triphosphohydrolase [bacterium]|nr:deoxyguanosinetriphosphate triphosphohydrolase [bacterium]
MPQPAPYPIPRTREQLDQIEDATLAPYACRAARSRGREVPEEPASDRTEFQRDRDRILHCAAFRRLEYKTQVFVTHEGDYFRTRLTHTLEVAQIARSIARTLGLNSDLIEAISLAHDLGHTPFGHTGEAVLNELLAGEGGFEHNAQSLRVVEVLEERFHDRPGLNLTWEVRAGIAQHSKATATPAVRRYHNGNQPSIEAQVADLADEIAYNHHDLDDALGMGLLPVEALREVDWLWEIWRRESERLPENSEPKHHRYRFLGALIEEMIHDVTEETNQQLINNQIESPEAALAWPTRLAGFTPKMRDRQDGLREFLLSRVYHHPKTLQMQFKAGEFFRKLFGLYEGHPELLPIPCQGMIEPMGLKRVLTDYLSGMTDRMCMEQYKEHFEC